MTFKPRKAQQVHGTVDVDEMFERAVSVLRHNSTEKGIRASKEKYNQVWSRDSFITLLGANLLEDPELLEAAKNSLITLGSAQSSLGMIPVNYDLDFRKPRWFFAGSTDSASWYILGLANLYSITHDPELLGASLDHAIAAFRWLRHQDSNNMLLIDSHPGSDWMDNSILRQGKTLYNNILFLMATKCMNRLCDISGKSVGPAHYLDYQRLEARFREFFSPGEDAIRSGIWPNLADYDRDFLTSRPREGMKFFPNFITFNHVDMHFDSLSNMLCILSGVSTPNMSESIMSYVHSNGLDSRHPIKSLYPTLKPGDRFYDYEYTQAKPEYWRNNPECYHNGGIWPFIGGFYLLALNKMGSAQFGSALQSLADANALVVSKGDMGFNEWQHGITGEPMGQDGQSWNAGMYIAAYLAGKGKDPFKFLRQ